MKKAFTLLELLVVIVIIAIMMAITMRFSGDFVYDIEFKKIKDSIVGDYHAVLGRNMSSRYVANDAYDQLAITIGASEDSIRYTYLTQEDEVVQERIEQYNKVAITNMMIDGRSVDAIPLHFVPYHVGCTIGEDESAMSKRATFEVSSTRSNKKFCFEIDSSSCKILSYLCLDEDNIRYYGN